MSAAQLATQPTATKKPESATSAADQKIEKSTDTSKAKAQETKAEKYAPKISADSKTKSQTAKKLELSSDEKLYDIPLRDAWKAKFQKRAPKAVSIIQEFAKRHLKTEKAKIGNSLNQLIWSRGNHWPPRQVKVKAVVHEGIAWVDLPKAEWMFLKTEEEKKQKIEELKKKIEEAKKEGPKEEQKKKEEKTEEAKKEEKKEVERVEKEVLKEEKSQIKKEIKAEKKKKDPAVHVKEPERVKG